MTDATAQLSETATYCAPNDTKRPGVVGLPDATTSQVCPDNKSMGADEVTNAYPDGWYVRVMFDELLDPSIETLTEITDDSGMGTGTFSGSIAATHPVTLQCQSATTGAMVNVDYDGYYSPAGNNVTWPLGPSLVIKPNDPTLIATGRECQVTLSDIITDKDGNTVPMMQRGPYKFKVAEITPIATDPTDSGDTTMPTEVDALGPYFDNFYFQFNTDVQLSSFCADVDGNGLCDGGTEAFEISPALNPSESALGPFGACDTSGNPCGSVADCVAGTDTHCDASYVYTYSGADADNEIGIGYTTPLKTETTYTFSLKAGAQLKDRCGAETTIPTPTAKNMFGITFKTNKFDLNKVTIATGETAAMSKKPTLQFSNVVDASSLDATEYSITPPPGSAAVGQLSGGDIILGGFYKPDTNYTLTIHAGATVEDAYGKVYTNAAEQTITWKTAPKIILSSSTADNTVIQKVLTVQAVGVALTFNADMVPSSLAATNYTLVNKAGTAVAIAPSAGSSAAGATCSATSSSCQVRFRADLPPDDYTFTLKAGATLLDALGTTYTQDKDLVIHFTVKAPPPPVQCL